MVLYRAPLLGEPLRWSGVQANSKKIVRKNPRQLKMPAPPVASQQQMEMAISQQAMSHVKRRETRAKMPSTKTAKNPQMTVLQEASVSETSLQAYSTHWESMKPFMQKGNGKLKPAKEVDRLLSNYLEELCMDGEDLSSAQYAVAALQFLNPDLKSPGVQKLPQAKQSLKGWKRLAPGKSRMPVPWEVTCLLVMHALEKRLKHLAFHMLVMFTLYLRPTEALRLRKCDVVPPASRRKRAYQRWTFVLHPHEVNPCRYLQMDQDYHRGIAEALMRWVNSSQTSDKDAIFNHRNLDLNQFLEESQKKLCLQKIGKIQCYRFRHGGASHDVANCEI